MEWQPQFKRGGKENKTALIQICGKDTILILQVVRLECKCFILYLLSSLLIHLAYRFTTSTCPILENENFIEIWREYPRGWSEAGTGFPGGMQCFRRFGSHMRLSLSSKAIQVLTITDRLFCKLDPCQRIDILANVLLQLEKNMKKSKKIQCSNWSKLSLTPAQLKYAANDAYVSVESTIFLFLVIFMIP